MTASPKATAATAEERAHVERAIERIENRTIGAMEGVHAPGHRAQAEALAQSGLPETARMLWAYWDGYEIVGGESRLLPLSQILAATRAAEAEGVLRPGDRVIGEAGRDRFVLPEDPWEEGAEVVRVEEDGSRLPEASSAAHLLLGLLAEASVMYDDDGEFRDDVIGEDAELTDAAQRKLLRRRLDHDEDAPRPRLELARLLRRAGELRAAERELRAVLKRAPDWSWAHHELAAVLAQSGKKDVARRHYEQAAEHAPDDDVRAYHLAWAASVAEGDAREAIAKRVLALRPQFAGEQLRAAQALIEDEDPDAAAQVVSLGLAVAPRNLELLALRRRQ